MPSTRKRAFLQVERLEDRYAPAVYAFNPAGAPASANWADGANWTGDGGYPDDANDTAILNGTTKNVAVVLPNNELTIGRLQTVNGYNKEISLSKLLTISNQNTLGDSSFGSSAILKPTATTAALVLDGVKLLVSQGTLGPSNSSLTPGLLTVKNGAELRFEMSASVVLGMNLLLGPTGSGNMVVKDVSAGYQNISLGLTNDADIIIDAGGELLLSGADGDGSILDDSPSAGTGTITVWGTMIRSNPGEVTVSLPVLVKQDGELRVLTPGSGTSTLRIASNGESDTNQRSVLVQEGGKVRLGLYTSDYSAVGFLVVNEDIVFDGGQLRLEGATSKLQANFVEFKNGGKLYSAALDGKFNDFYFILTGQNAQVKLTSGAFDLRIGGTEYQGAHDVVRVEGGKLDIAQANTTLKVTLDGTPPAEPPPAWVWDLLYADDIVNDFAAFVDVGDDLNKSIVTIGSDEVIRITTA